MTISVALLTSGTKASAGTSAPTASISPGTDKLILVGVRNTRNAGTPAATPTVTGNGLTYEQVVTAAYSTIAAATRRLTLFRAMGTPTPGALALDCGAESQAEFNWIVVEVSGVITGANGAHAIGDTDSASQDVTGIDDDLALALSFADLENGSFSIWACTTTGGNDILPASGWTELADVNNRLEAQWRADNGTPSVDFNLGTGRAMAGLAVELLNQRVPGTVVAEVLPGSGLPPELLCQTSPVDTAVDPIQPLAEVELAADLTGVEVL